MPREFIVPDSMDAPSRESPRESDEERLGFTHQLAPCNADYSYTGGREHSIATSIALEHPGRRVIRESIDLYDKPLCLPEKSTS